MNLPNAITAGRIVVTPLIALLPLVDSWTARAIAFVLYVIAAVTDYYDGMLARTRNLVTDLGKLLDPLADKLLLLGTFIPMYLLGGAGSAWSPFIGSGLHYAENFRAGVFPFETPWGAVTLPLWIVLVVLGRELLMTIFRQVAARRGVVIAAIGPAKWKTAFQSIWVGSAYFWFAYASWLVTHLDASTSPAVLRFLQGFAYFNGIVGTISMFVAVGLTLYSLALYFQRYGYLLRGRAPAVER
ncbi:MAG TPA: CDP-alcohol phosphatidyltransferase family protein [Gemmatimonadaceae bacterium]